MGGGGGGFSSVISGLFSGGSGGAGADGGLSLGQPVGGDATNQPVSDPSQLYQIGPANPTPAQQTAADYSIDPSYMGTQGLSSDQLLAGQGMNSTGGSSGGGGGLGGMVAGLINSFYANVPQATYNAQGPPLPAPAKFGALTLNPNRNTMAPGLV